MRVTRRSGSRLVAALVLVALGLPVPAASLSTTRNGEISLGMRAYTAARVATEGLDEFSFPPSSAGHLRQHRYFLELEFKHKLTNLVQNSSGPLAFLRDLPFPVDHLSYNVTYRGEGEGLYDYGPKAYTTFDDYKTFKPDKPDTLQPSRREMLDFGREFQSRMRRVGRQRHRVFQAYVDLESGPVFVRIGRQNLSWGETDVFRLLDNINPLENGFGGFFIPLDERRIPLDMARASVVLPHWGPFFQAFIEAFGAFGNRVSHQPGIPTGSPWSPGALNFPNTDARTLRKVPDRGDLRGGGRLVSNVGDITFSVAHYWTYLDTPSVRLRIPAGVPTIDNRILSLQSAPRVPVSGASMTFAVPQLYAVVRSEFAYFHGEPAHCQGIGTADQAIQQPNSTNPTVKRNLRRLRRNLHGCIDPFRYPSFITTPKPVHGTNARRDSVNFSLGLDFNRYIRWLNPHQTFFFTTQVFFKHVVNAFPDHVLPVNVRKMPLTLNTSPFGPLLNGRTLEPRFAKVAENQVLHTLSIRTSYRGGTIEPSMNVFYDWNGVWFYQPGVRLVRDPFRVIIDYTGISGVLGGTIGLLRDRDNARFQVEVVF